MEGVDERSGARSALVQALLFVSLEHGVEGGAEVGVFEPAADRSLVDANGFSGFAYGGVGEQSEQAAALDSGEWGVAHGVAPGSRIGGGGK
ncbi:MAG: hypothetical protein R2724_27195 [Bryobacterales bacterium]